MTEDEKMRRESWRAYAAAALQGSLASQTNELTDDDELHFGVHYNWHLRRACAFAEDMLESEERFFSGKPPLR